MLVRELKIWIKQLNFKQLSIGSWREKSLTGCLYGAGLAIIELVYLLLFFSKTDGGERRNLLSRKEAFKMASEIDGGADGRGRNRIVAWPGPTLAMYEMK